MIRVEIAGIRLASQALDACCTQMREEIQGAPAMLAALRQEATAMQARTLEDRNRLQTELRIVRDLSVRNQDALFALEDRLGSDLTKLQTAECEKDAAVQALQLAETSLREAEEMELPDPEDPGYRLLADGRAQAIRHMKKNIQAAQGRIARAEAQMEKLDSKLDGVRPMMERCRYHLETLGKTASAITKELRQVEKFLQNLTTAMEQLDSEQDTLLQQMQIAADRMEVPRKLAADALTDLTAYQEAIAAIRWGDGGTGGTAGAEQIEPEALTACSARLRRCARQCEEETTRLKHGLAAYREALDDTISGNAAQAISMMTQKLTQVSDAYLHGAKQLDTAVACLEHYEQLGR